MTRSEGMSMLWCEAEISLFHGATVAAPAKTTTISAVLQSIRTRDLSPVHKTITPHPRHARRLRLYSCLGTPGDRDVLRHIYPRRVPRPICSSRVPLCTGISTIFPTSRPSRRPSVAMCTPPIASSPPVAMDSSLEQKLRSLSHPLQRWQCDL